MALSQVEEAKDALIELELGHTAKRLHNHLHGDQGFLTSAWEHTQKAFLVNAGITYVFPDVMFLIH